MNIALKAQVKSSHRLAKSDLDVYNHCNNLLVINDNSTLKDITMNLTTKIIFSLIFGALCGFIINVFAAPDSWLQTIVVSQIFHTIGTLFVSALKMLVVPLVIFSLIPGIVGMGDIALLGRVGWKAFALYLLTTAIAITTTLFLASFFNIGSGLSLETESEFSGKAPPPLSQVIMDIVPSNALEAMANGDMLAIIFFSIVFGVALLAVAKESPDVIRFIEQMNTVMMSMVNLVMAFAPYAVFALIAKAIAQLGLGLLTELASYALVLVAALFFHALFTLMLLLKVFSGLSPKIFLNKIRNAQLFAFSTASSGATIPVTLRATETRMGVNRSIASFTVPFGATINMDGTAMMQGAATVFIANIYGIDLGLSGYLMVVLMSVLASIGTAAVPGVGLVMLTMVFNQVGLPVEGIGLVLGIDRILDMLRTSVNVTGDAVVTLVVAKSEGQIDLEAYERDIL